MISGEENLRDISKIQLYVIRPSLEEIFRNVTDKCTRNDKVYDANMKYGYTMREIAGYLGLHYSTVSLIIKKYS